MTYFKGWIAAVFILSIVFMGSCATRPSREPTDLLSRPALDQAGVAKRQYSIPGFGALEFSVPPSWQEEIQPEKADSYFAFTVRYTGRAPEDFRVLISIYVEAVTLRGAPGPDTIKSVLEEASKGSRTHAIEKDIAMIELSCPGGKGFYFPMTDAAYKAGKPGDYQYMTQGLCPVGERLLFFTILTNSKDSEVVERALHAVRTAEISSERMVSETLIAQMGIYSWSKESFKVSLDSKRVAFAARMGNKWFVVVDGKEEKQYEGIGLGNLIFSPDSKRLAYVAGLANKEFVVVDGKEEKQYEGIGLGNLIFSPDSQRLAYAAQRDKKWFVVVGGKEEKQYDSIGKSSLIFSPDSKHLVYAARRGKKWFVVVDGKEEKQYDATGSPIFSPDSKRVAYRAKLGNKHFVVVDGKEEKQYDATADFIFSPNSKRASYMAKLGNKWFVVVDGKAEKEYDGTGEGTLIFSPDSQRLAYAAQRDKKWFVVVDGKEEKGYDGIGIGTLIFSPNTERLAYRAQVGNKQFVVVDGKEEKGYDGTGAPIFSSDSKRLAYVAGLANKQFVVVDGKEGDKYDDIFFGGSGRIIFNSSEFLHYIARKGSNIYLVEKRIK